MAWLPLCGLHKLGDNYFLLLLSKVKVKTKKEVNQIKGSVKTGHHMKKKKLQTKLHCQSEIKVKLNLKKQRSTNNIANLEA